MAEPEKILLADDEPQILGLLNDFLGGLGPAPDRHGGPILCQWMLDAGYTDLRK